MRQRIAGTSRLEVLVLLIVTVIGTAGLTRDKTTNHFLVDRRLVHSATDTLPDELEDFCVSMKWDSMCTVPERTDDGRLNNGRNDYGPYAMIVPAAGLKNFTAATSSAPRAAAVIYVQREAFLPPTYTALKLAFGLNCLYLSFTSGTWRAHVRPAIGKSCPITGFTDAQRLPVRALLNPSYSASADVPETVRFHEGTTTVNQVSQPLLGIKCENRWCVVGPKGYNLVSFPGESPTAPKKVAIRGWHDAQYLGLGHGKAKYTKNMPGMVLPGPGTELVGENNFKDFRHVATVILNRSTKGTKYETDWHFAQGRNEVWIKKESATKWISETRRQCGLTICHFAHTWPVVRTDHNGDYPPATVRFRWLEDDEGLWARCDDGCCQVGGGGSGVTGGPGS